MVSGPGLLLASVIAWRSEPEPESLMLVTVKGAAWAGFAASRPQSRPTITTVTASIEPFLVRAIFRFLLFLLFANPQAAFRR
jgi:hypothetical protein